MYLLSYLIVNKLFIPSKVYEESNGLDTAL